MIVQLLLEKQECLSITRTSSLKHASSCENPSEDLQELWDICILSIQADALLPTFKQELRCKFATAPHTP